MPSRIGVLKWVFLGLFGVLSLSFTAYQWAYVIPKKKCEAKHWWWSEKDRGCYQPVPLYTVTGKLPDMPGKAPAAAAEATAQSH